MRSRTIFPLIDREPLVVQECLPNVHSGVERNPHSLTQRAGSHVNNLNLLVKCFHDGFFVLGNQEGEIWIYDLGATAYSGPVKTLPPLTIAGHYVKIPNLFDAPWPAPRTGWDEHLESPGVIWVFVWTCYCAPVLASRLDHTTDALLRSQWLALKQLQPRSSLQRVFSALGREGSFIEQDRRRTVRRRSLGSSMGDRWKWLSTVHEISFFHTTSIRAGVLVCPCTSIPRFVSRVEILISLYSVPGAAPNVLSQENAEHPRLAPDRGIGSVSSSTGRLVVCIVSVVKLQATLVA